MRSACPIDEPAQGVTACGLSAWRRDDLDGLPVGVAACHGAERVPCRSTFTASMNRRRAWRCDLSASGRRRDDLDGLPTAWRRADGAGRDGAACRHPGDGVTACHGAERVPCRSTFTASDEPAQGVTACGLSASGRRRDDLDGVPVGAARDGALLFDLHGVTIWTACRRRGGVTVRPVGVAACHGAERVPYR